MKTFGYIVLIAAFAAVNATSCVDRGYAEPTPCECPNYLASNLEWTADDEFVSPGPGARGAGGGCGATFLNTPTFLNNVRTFTASLPAGGRTGSVLQVQYDNELIRCSLNGNIIPGSENLDSGFCCHVDGCSAIEIPDHFWEIENTLSCTVEDHGVLAFFDATVCGDVVGPLNPLEPECRQKFLNEEDGLLHLINRNDEGDMGCVSDEECIQYTSADSWCKSDGTCRGCDDWEGCCDLGNDPPAEPYDCSSFRDLIGQDTANAACVYFATSCSNSYCQEDGTCFPCEADFEEDVESLIAVRRFGDSLGALFAKLDDACRNFHQCPEAKALIREDQIQILDNGQYSNDGEFFICLPACNGAEPGYDDASPIECTLGGEDDVFCRESTGCSASYCKESGPTSLNRGLCHVCDLDDYPSEENPVPTCTGINDIEHEACKVATGCSHSYCKGAVCQLCEDDGYTGADA